MLTSAAVNPLRCGTYRDLWVSASDDGQRLDMGLGCAPGRGTLLTTKAAELRRPGCNFVDGYHLKHDRHGYDVYMRVHRNATGWRNRALGATIRQNHDDY